VYHFSLHHYAAFFIEIALWTAVGAVSHRLSLLRFWIRLPYS